MVGPERLELSHRKALDPKSSASTNFATGPNWYRFTYIISSILYRQAMARFIRLAFLLLGAQAPTSPQSSFALGTCSMQLPACFTSLCAIALIKLTLNSCFLAFPILIKPFCRFDISETAFAHKAIICLFRCRTSMENKNFNAFRIFWLFKEV